MVCIESGWMFTKKGTCFDDDFKNRYVLTARNMKSTSKSILISFLMNPSHAGKQKNCDRFSSIISDETINLLLRTIGKSYGTVIVFNNIPLREPTSEKIGKINNESLRINERVISCWVSRLNSYDLYLGTGNVGTSKGNIIKNLYINNMNLLCDRKNCSKIYVSGLNNSGFSMHPKPRRFSYDVINFLLNSKRQAEWNRHTQELTTKN